MRDGYGSWNRRQDRGASGAAALLACCLGLFSFSFPASAQTISYCTNPFYPPYDWAVGPNAYDGAGPALLSMLLPHGYTLRPETLPWKRAQSMAAAGDVDLLLCIRITPERSAYLDFTSVPVFRNPIVVFVRKDRPVRFDSWADLKGYLGGVSVGDKFGGGFDEYLKKELKYEEAPSMIENFRKLADGRIDYFVSGYFMGMSWIRTDPAGRNIMALTPPISDEGIYIGVSKKSPRRAVLGVLDEALKSLDERGVPDKLLEEYLNRYIRERPSLFNP